MHMRMCCQGGLSSPTLLQAGVHHFPSLLLPEHRQDSLAAQSGAFLLSSPSAGAVCGAGLAAPTGFDNQDAAQPPGHANTPLAMQQLP